MLREIFTSQRQFIDYFFENVDMDDAEVVLSEFLKCKGTLMITGVGKSGIIADKLAKTLISTGTKAMYLPIAGALHGDIGVLGVDDLVVILSKSGKTPEILEFAQIVARRRLSSMAWISDRNTPLEGIVDKTIHLPLTRELCPFDLAPTTSTAVQLIYGDVIAVALMKAKNFSLDQYALNHPGGAIGKLISEKVGDVMSMGEELPVCRRKDKLKEVLVELTNKRLGCIMIVDDQMVVEGIFTDGDLRRAIAEVEDDVLNLPMSQLLTTPFLSTTPETLASHALEKMEGVKKVMMLPVLDEEGKLAGVVHLHHILSPKQKQILVSSKFNKTVA